MSKDSKLGLIWAIIYFALCYTYCLIMDANPTWAQWVLDSWLYNYMTNIFFR